MTVGELRKALQDVPSGAEVRITIDSKGMYLSDILVDKCARGYDYQETFALKCSKRHDIVGGRIDEIKRDLI